MNSGIRETYYHRKYYMVGHRIAALLTNIVNDFFILASKLPIIIIIFMFYSNTNRLLITILEQIEEKHTQISLIYVKYTFI